MNCDFGNGNVDFKQANFGDGGVDFKFAKFGSGDLSFERALFGPGNKDFNEKYVPEECKDASKIGQLKPLPEKSIKSKILDKFNSIFELFLSLIEGRAEAGELEFNFDVKDPNSVLKDTSYRLTGVDNWIVFLKLDYSKKRSDGIIINEVSTIKEVMERLAKSIANGDNKKYLRLLKSNKYKLLKVEIVSNVKKYVPWHNKIAKIPTRAERAFAELDLDEELK